MMSAILFFIWEYLGTKTVTLPFLYFPMFHIAYSMKPAAFSLWMRPFVWSPKPS